MKRLLIIALLGLSACAENPFRAQADETVTVGAPMSAMAPPPPPNATTEESFDTTSEEDRVAAAAVDTGGGERGLGTTIATLGSPTEPGFWLETPLVTAVTQGRVVAKNGKSANLELRPIDGPATAGSRISLPALRILEVGLAGLHEVSVFAK
ncbi:D-galactarate dehydratase [Maritimibacter dapengensis]|uniref:D-galactarate dehydratase n=1 Tax=Maritimibacter dapengensis TaxID=2836868 RepID=A0ABS6SZB6_9RHOB|nr:D-galactarate dehydratase [Maritimibacter dapengensis]MBV7378275.1 D-galactarate dehydratase [Maritimibacter dapengensis]